MMCDKMQQRFKFNILLYKWIVYKYIVHKVIKVTQCQYNTISKNFFLQ